MCWGILTVSTYFFYISEIVSEFLMFGNTRHKASKVEYIIQQTLYELIETIISIRIHGRLEDHFRCL